MSLELQRSRAREFAEPVVGRAAEPFDLTPLLHRFSKAGVPKNVALYEAVVFAAASGLARAGTRLPNEKDLASTLPLSLGTIQRAMRRLVDDRIIERRPGLGSFFADHSYGEMEEPFHCRFVADGGDGYLPVYPSIVSRELTTDKGPWTAHLGCTEVLRIVRRVRIGNEFFVHCTVYADPRRLPMFRSLPLTELDSANFKQLIFNATGQQVDRVDTLITQSIPADDICHRIDVQPGQLCLELCAHAFLGAQDPVYTQIIVVPPTQRPVHIVSDSRTHGYSRK